MMAAGVATAPLADLAHKDGTPRFEFMQRANRVFDKAESQNADNLCYEPCPADAPRHLGLIAEAVLAERAAIHEAVTSAMAAPGTGPESDSLSRQRVEVLVTIFGPTRDGRMHSLDLGSGPHAALCGRRLAHSGVHVPSLVQGASVIYWLTGRSRLARRRSRGSWPTRTGGEVPARSCRRAAGGR
jgi:hypothetical protein